VQAHLYATKTRSDITGVTHRIRSHRTDSPDSRAPARQVIDAGASRDRERLARAARERHLCAVHRGGRGAVRLKLRPFDRGTKPRLADSDLYSRHSKPKPPSRETASPRRLGCPEPPARGRFVRRTRRQRCEAAEAAFESKNACRENLKADEAICGIIEAKGAGPGNWSWPSALDASIQPSLPGRQ
jgi:hypothetical protein